MDRILSKIQVNDLPVTVVNCRFFKPIDTACIDQFAKRGIPVIVFETDMKESGLAASILEYLCDSHQTMNLTRMGIGDEYVQQGAVNLLRRDEGIDLNSLYEKLMELL